MIHGRHQGDNAAHLGGRENDGQFELRGGTSKLQFGGPGPAESFFPEEFDGAQDLSGALAGESPLGFEINEILTEFFGADQVGGAVEVLGQLAQASPITLLAAGLERQEGQVVGEALQDCMGGTFFIFIAAILTGLLAVCRASVPGEPSAA
jgi:hypothetical protein